MMFRQRQRLGITLTRAEPITPAVAINHTRTVPMRCFLFGVGITANLSNLVAGQLVHFTQLR